MGGSNSMRGRIAQRYMNWGEKTMAADQIILASEQPRPRTAVATVFAVYRGAASDAMLPLTVVVPWRNLRDVVTVDLLFHVPEGFEPEIVRGDTNFLLCSCRVVRTGAVQPMGGELPMCIDVTVCSESATFLFGTKFPNARGTAGLQVGQSGERMQVHAFGRIVGRVDNTAQQEPELAHV
jgi:hypothetical protein